MRLYIFFRILIFLCLASIICIACLYYFNIIADKNFAIVTGIIALLVGFFGVFANRPFKKEDVSVAVDKVLLTYDEDTFKNLKQAKEEEEKIKDFVEHRSNEIFLLKLRSYLEDEIMKKYNNSDISKLIGELEAVERQLDERNVEYNEIELPKRFRRILKEIDKRERINLYLDMIDALPFFPLKKFTKAYFRLQYKQRYNS